MLIRTVENDQQLKDAFGVRRTVFIKEQQVPEDLELDEYDDLAVHFIGYENNEPIAAARLRFVEENGKLERICVMKEFRGRSFGRQMIEAMEKRIQKEGLKQAKLNAQTHAEDFYRAIGYETISGQFMDAGIPHVTMIKTLD
ncbi:Predicted N-acyltransferase, GNAT family [Thalassobacillus cyri]|uniref:Predicted N-acyltransferase, GNAT family n=1 Tax=Thalassobacillus cyri TaxID=571932 RepID=A0A1H3VMB6_9BACI|nr:GNAT family N-acetyltransferase [Thalassobacillus cyri]SDZ75925.1 Predicted N-acyltransferase, GNAT family [Thalassobacillus cyri]